MTHTQKIDGRHVLLVALIFAMGAVLLAGVTPLPPSIARMAGWLAIVLGVLAAWEAAATRYEFGRSELVIHSGGTRQRIRYEAIEAIRLARGLGRCLGSSNRVRLFVSGRSATVVSLCPKNRDQFLHELSRAVPWLAVTER